MVKGGVRVLQEHQIKRRLKMSKIARSLLRNVKYVRNHEKPCKISIARSFEDFSW